MSKRPNPRCPHITLTGERCKLPVVNGRDTCRHALPYDGTLVNPGVLRCETCRKPWPCPKAGT